MITYISIVTTTVLTMSSLSLQSPVFYRGSDAPLTSGFRGRLHVVNSTGHKLTEDTRAQVVWTVILLSES